MSTFSLEINQGGTLAETSSTDLWEFAWDSFYVGFYSKVVSAFLLGRCDLVTFILGFLIDLMRFLAGILAARL